MRRDRQGRFEVQTELQRHVWIKRVNRARHLSIGQFRDIGCAKCAAVTNDDLFGNGLKRCTEMLHRFEANHCFGRGVDTKATELLLVIHLNSLADHEDIDPVHVQYASLAKM